MYEPNTFDSREEAQYGIDNDSNMKERYDEWEEINIISTKTE